MTGVVGGVAGGIPGGTAGGVVGGIPAPPPPPPAAPVRVGGDIKEPRKLNEVKPVYPQIAQTAKISGIVIIEATIGRDGRVKDAKVLRSVQLLDQAALDAVKQWIYTPTLLNGVPVEVIMVVTVNFTLNRE
jgi:protein TonB